MLPVPNMDSYNQQLSAIRAQLANYQQPQPIPLQTPNTVQNPVQMPSQIKYVDGIPGAKEYQSKMLPNSSEVIMDKNDDVFYVVSKDANGVSPKKIPFSRFSLEFEETDEPAYVTKKDFDAFESRILEILGAKNAQEVEHE